MQCIAPINVINAKMKKRARQSKAFRNKTRIDRNKELIDVLDSNNICKINNTDEIEFIKSH